MPVRKEANKSKKKGPINLSHETDNKTTVTTTTTMKTGLLWMNNVNEQISYLIFYTLTFVTVVSKEKGNEGAYFN